MIILAEIFVVGPVRTGREVMSYPNTALTCLPVSFITSRVYAVLTRIEVRKDGSRLERVEKPSELQGTLGRAMSMQQAEQRRRLAVKHP
jgi:hypothetical protein